MKNRTFIDFKFLYQNLIRIIFTPVMGWNIITEENRTSNYLRNNLLFPILIIVSIAAFLGSLIFTNATLPAIYSVFTGIRFFLLFLIVAYLSALMLGEITKPLDLGKNFSVSFRLIVYSLTPLFLCQIVSQLFESLIFVNILGLYGMYIFWTGAEKMLNPPDYKKMPLLITIFVVITGFFFAGNWVLTSLTDRIYYLFFA
jgi:hypothetical protein